MVWRQGKTISLKDGMITAKRPLNPDDLRRGDAFLRHLLRHLSEEREEKAG